MEWESMLSKICLPWSGQWLITASIKCSTTYVVFFPWHFIMRLPLICWTIVLVYRFFEMTIWCHTWPLYIKLKQCPMLTKLKKKKIYLTAFSIQKCCHCLKHLQSNRLINNLEVGRRPLQSWRMHQSSKAKISLIYLISMRSARQRPVFG